MFPYIRLFFFFIKLCCIAIFFMQIYLDSERKLNQIEKRSERAWYSRDGCSWQLCAWNMRGMVARDF